MGPDKEGMDMAELYGEVRKMRVLEAAWRRVRSRGLLSASKEIRAEVAEFDEHPIGRLRRIQGRLKAKTFRFAPQKGIAKARPGKSSRPIVIAPVENRIVQRAILDTLAAKCGAVRDVLNIPTSVGGIDGVDVAIAIVTKAIADGATWCVRSDIPQFFTKIPKTTITALMSILLFFRAIYQSSIDSAPHCTAQAYRLSRSNEHPLIEAPDGKSPGFGLINLTGLVFTEDDVGAYAN